MSFWARGKGAALSSDTEPGPAGAGMSDALQGGKGLLSESRDDLTPQGARVPSNNSPSFRKGVASPSPVGVRAHSGAGGAQEHSAREPRVSIRQGGPGASRHGAGQCTDRWAGAAPGCRRDAEGRKEQSDWLGTKASPGQV